MKKTRKWLAALGSAFLLAVALLVPGIGEVQAAEPTMTVSIGDVPDAKVGEEIEIPITISSSDGLRGAVGKLNDENGALYDTGVLEYLGASNSLGADMSTAGGNYGFITMSEFHEVTINLKFKVLKCQPAPVSVTTKDLYASTASASTGKKNLTAIVTIAHGDLHEEVTKQATNNSVQVPKPSPADFAAIKPWRRSRQAAESQEEPTAAVPQADNLPEERSDSPAEIRLPEGPVQETARSPAGAVWRMVPECRQMVPGLRTKQELVRHWEPEQMERP